MIDYREMRRKFPALKSPSGSAERKAKIKAIAREYERKRAELGLGDGPPRRRFPYYMAIVIGMLLVSALVCSSIFERGGVGLGQDLDAKARLCVHNLAIALGRYRYHVGRYPSTEGGLNLLAVKRSEIPGWNGPYIRAVHRDPWNHEYVYRYNGETADPTLYSPGPDGIAATPDDIVAERADFDAAFRDTSWTRGWMPQHLRGYVLAQNERHRRQIEAEVESILHPEVPVDGCRLLNDGWSFAPSVPCAPSAADDVAGRSCNDPLDASSLPWRPVELPHDWTTEESTGVGYYRRELSVSPKARGRFIALRFAGVMGCAEVWFNGERLAAKHCCAIGFEVDLSEKIHFDRPNELVVRVDAAGRNCPGAGICRDVKLAIEDPVERVLANSLRIEPVSIAPEVAKMRAVYERPDGTVTNDFEVAEPICWQPERPFLYKLEICGEYYTYGIRTAEAKPDGFYLNGERLQLKGVVLHSDLGLLGRVFNRQAALRQLAMLKDLGVNAISFSRIPPDPQMLDLCDLMGFVVWDGDGAMPATCCGELARRDCNHPSVVHVGGGVGAEPARGFVCLGHEDCGCPVQNRKIVDSIGLPLEDYWECRARWNVRDNTIRLLPHWNWEGREGQLVLVAVCTSGDEAELFLNGESRGRIRKSGRIEWDCPYEPGEIKSIVYRNGVYLGETSCKTAMKPRELRVSTDREALDEGDLAFLTVEAYDDYGVLAPLCDASVELSVEGPGEIVAAGNGCAGGRLDHATAATIRLDRSRAVVVVRRRPQAATGNPFTLVLRAAGMRAARLVMPRRRSY